MTVTDTELARVLERAETMRDLLRVYGAHDSNATKSELLCGAADGARALEDAARLLREMAADFARAGKRCDALDNMLVAYRVGRRPSEATFSALEKHSSEWLDAARDRWRVKP